MFEPLAAGTGGNAADASARQNIGPKAVKLRTLGSGG